MHKKVALPTGANAGIGKATAIALPKKGLLVVMLCTSRKRGKAAMGEPWPSSPGGVQIP